MADLKAAFEKLGFSDATTVLQSGNVLFTSPRSTEELKPAIESNLNEVFHYPAIVQVLPLEKLKAIVSACPFDAFDQEFHAYVIFFENGLEQKLASEATLTKDIESIQVSDGVLYWQVVRGMTLKSSFAAYLTKQPYKSAHTNRNIRTLYKVIAAEKAVSS